MTRIVIAINLFFYLFGIAVNLIDFVSNGDLKSLTFIFFCSANIYCLIRLNQEKNVLLNLRLLGISNLIQSFSFILFGFTMKILIGTDFSVYIINTGDQFVKFSFKFFNFYLLIKHFPGDTTTGIGIHFLHLLFAGYFICGKIQAPKNNRSS